MNSDRGLLFFEGKRGVFTGGGVSNPPISYINNIDKNDHYENKIERIRSLAWLLLKKEIIRIVPRDDLQLLLLSHRNKRVSVRSGTAIIYIV